MKSRHHAVSLILLFVAFTIAANAQNPVFPVAAPVTAGANTSLTSLTGLTGNVTSTAGVISMSADADSTHILGRLRIAMRPSASDQVALSHYDLGNLTTNWGLNFASTGDVYINTPTAAAGFIIYENLVQYMRFDGGQFMFGVGTALNPIITIFGDNNTGIYSSGGDALDFATGGTRRGGFTPTGNLEATGSVAITGSLSVGGGTALSKFLSATGSLDFGNTSAQSSADLTITVTGAAVGDSVSIGVPNGSVSANTCFSGWVSATNTVTVRFNNYSSGAVDPSSGTFRATVIQF
jgi:hypothetical protein